MSDSQCSAQTPAQAHPSAPARPARGISDSVPLQASRLLAAARLLLPYFEKGLSASWMALYGSAKNDRSPS